MIAPSGPLFLKYGSPLRASQLKLIGSLYAVKKEKNPISLHYANFEEILAIIEFVLKLSYKKREKTNLLQ